MSSGSATSPSAHRRDAAPAYERGIRRIVTAGLLLAITLLMAFTPIGFIPVPTPAGSATIAHIPAIIGGILEGPLVAVIVGLGFGFGSLMSPAVPVKDPLVVVLPRLFIGITAWWVFALLRRANKGVLTAILAVLFVLLLGASYEVSKKILWLGIVVAVASVAITVGLYVWMRREEVLVFSLAVAGVAGSLTNTILVLSAAIWRLPELITPAAALTIGLTQGIPEAIVSAIVVVAVVSALRQIHTRRRGARL
jgi:uncharacterized membrane protein